MRLYQVVWNIDNEATVAREKRALTQACEETNLPGELITPSRPMTTRQDATLPVFE